MFYGPQLRFFLVGETLYLRSFPTPLERNKIFSFRSLSYVSSVCISPPCVCPFYVLYVYASSVCMSLSRVYALSVCMSPPCVYGSSVCLFTLCVCPFRRYVPSVYLCPRPQRVYVRTVCMSPSCGCPFCVYRVYPLRVCMSLPRVRLLYVHISSQCVSPLCVYVSSVCRSPLCVCHLHVSIPFVCMPRPYVCPFRMYLPSVWCVSCTITYSRKCKEPKAGIPQGGAKRGFFFMVGCE